MWLLKCVLIGPKYASLQEETNPRAVADLPLPAGLRGIRARGRHGEGEDGQSSNLLIMLRETEIKRQLRKLMRPWPGQSLSPARMGGRGACRNEQTASSSPAGKTGSELLANPVAQLVRVR